VVEILRSQQLHGQRAREIGSKLRLRGAQTRDEAQATVLQITGELAGLAEKTAGKAEKLLVNARRALRRARAKAAELATVGGHDAVAGRRRGRLCRAAYELADLLGATPTDCRADPPTPVRHRTGQGDPPSEPSTTA
jgi:transposase, IS5 family